MAENTKIEWAHHTFNPWIGCTKVGPGCDHCYAETLATSRLGVIWGNEGERRRTAASTWKQPRRWNNRAAARGVRERVFCASLADVFDNRADPAVRAELFQLIRETPQLDWLLVTKRIGNAAAMAEAAGGMPENVWLGATIVNQEEANRDIPKLLATPASVRFLSMEPLLGPVDLEVAWHGENALYSECWGDCSWCKNGHPPLHNCAAGRQSEADWMKARSGLDWVIVGGESGPGARPMHPDWARQLRQQCADAGVPFLFKQWGEWREWDDGNGNPEPEEVEDDSEYADMVYASAIRPALISADGSVYSRDELPEEVPCRLVERVGKRVAGRLLDGVEHTAFPGEVTHG
ncbi:phage Gp37/Gp68 family protein [Sphingomonas sp. ABOLE]|uniref:phage Gp37/Gp68 family protein n=1 Tax=Sphingomonas sp. ABOLE TaxID=1985878 RepID=UPI000F7D9258|nr:phage Gp37/Gp68 family protein [Sphingomonas sp. ABOLE]RSV41509.1 phage Gp37/Gp68 family protein [Sphingomonas sp. ABOLE]